MRILYLLVAVTGATNTASATVVDSAESGFTIVHEEVVAATPMQAWRAAVGEVGHWWSDDHTITGDASKLRIDARPLGCFCETLGGNAGVVHLTVTFVNPGVLLRLTGGLGPLGLLGVDGNMTWEFNEVNGGTAIRFTYAVGGYRAGGLDELAAPVDRVVVEALQSLKLHITETVNDASD